jgi:hypothetical protein
MIKRIEIPRGKNSGINRWANKYPAICYKCGKMVPAYGGRLIAGKTPLRVQCLSHIEFK